MVNSVYSLTNSLTHSLVQIFRVGLVVLVLITLLGCQNGQAPREFAPSGAIIQRAMELKLTAYYKDLSQTIAAPTPMVEVKNIYVKQLDSFFLHQLPVYHVAGTYDVAIAFNHRIETRPRNTFDLYLQRQREGKTWRSLTQDKNGWHSYPLPPE
jgi:hypothetical protein